MYRIVDLYILQKTNLNIRKDRIRVFTLRNYIVSLIWPGRLEILGGAWVMGDAAVTLYNDFIDQQTLGLQFIHDTLGPCALPRCVWHMDQFGHSREYASLLAQVCKGASFEK